MTASVISKHRTARDAVNKTLGQGIGLKLGLPKGSNPLLDSLLADLERAETCRALKGASAVSDTGPPEAPAN